MNDENRQKIEIFISYAHEDEDLLNKLVSHLSQLKRDGLIETWHDRRLTGGQEWAGQIDDHLENAHIVLLLISADFIDSKYCYDIEMKRALDRHNNHEARVIPVILRPTDWRNAPFGKLQALPRDGRPVVKFETLDDGFLEVAQGLRNIVSQWNVNIPLTPGSVDIPEFPPPKRPWKIKALLIAALIIVLLAGTGAFWNHYRQIVAIEASTCQRRKIHAGGAVFRSQGRVPTGTESPTKEQGSRFRAGKSHSPRSAGRG
ncbi:toll/interleukin-1 receptor domain-containing protein [Desulfosarcina cetonica]|uniref:toll/interleukin-1 receptor domain-containing protein n=1 Tax=Desulfosarcina cetonica TaxID=90730 RepID=UPI0006D24E89|nr:toll/interleukin-1 receptor domain-containing protein [Desulfosarcina cetonica]